MNRQRSQEIQVGVMVVIGMVILVVGLMFFKRISLRTDMVPYAVEIPAVEGLRRGDRVQVRGIRVGQVVDFEILPGTVRVNIEVEDWVELCEDADVTLVMKGLVGEVLLEIEPGRGLPVRSGHVFTGRSAASMMALGDKVNEAMRVVTDLGEDIRLLVTDLREGDRIRQTLGATGRAFGEAADLLGENRQALSALLADLNGLIAVLTAALGDGKLDSTRSAVDRALISLEATLVELRAAAQDGRALLAGLERGEGTAGRLLTDPTLYDRADSTLQSLDRLLDQMRRDPKAVFRMSLF